MGTRNVLVTAFLLLVAGGGLAWFLARGDADEPQRGGGVAPASVRGAPESARPDTDLRGTGVGDAGAARTVAGRIEAPVERRETAAGAVSAAPDEATPALSGRVLDPFGRPIEGATVLAADRDGFPLDLAAGGELPPFVKRSGATTDAEGRFALDGLAPPSIRLLVRASGYAPHAEERIPLPDVATFELADVILDPGGILEGLVVDPYGRGVADAELFVEPTDGFRFRGFLGGVSARPNAVTDAQGRFRIDVLALGAWRVRVASEEHPDRTFEGLAERAGEIMTRRFELERGDAIAGRVTGVPDAERDDLLVRAAPSQSGDFFGFAGAGSRDARVEESGEFVVKGLRADAEYTLQVRMRDDGSRFAGFNARTRSELVPARAGRTGVEVPYRPEAAVLFQVVDAQTNEPIEEYQVESGFRWKEPLLGDDMRPIALHPEGRARIGNLRPDASPASLEVAIQAVGYHPWERDDVQVVSASETDLGVVRLEPLPMVRVTVVDAATGAPVPDAEVTLEEQYDEPGGFERGFRERRVSIRFDDSTGTPVAVGDPGRSARTDAEGLALLNSLEGKRATLRVRRDGYAPAALTGLELPVGSPVDQVVELGRGGVVVARVVDEFGAAVAGVRVDHRAPEAGGALPQPFLPGRRGDPVTNQDGEVRFEHLAAGEHRFRIERTDGNRRSFGGGFVVAMNAGEQEEPGWESVAVSEGGQEEVTLVRRALGSLTGRITEVGVELAGATVRLAPAARGREGFDFGRAFGGGEVERSDSSGRYELEDVEPGEYVLTVSHPKRRMPMELEIEIDAGRNRLDVELPLSILEGRITDEDGKPLSGIEVTARRAGGRGGSATRGRMVFRAIGGGAGETGGAITFGDDDLGDATRTDADGAYSLRGVMPDVELVVRATGAGVQPGESRAVQVAPNEVKRGVDLTLEPAGAARVEAFQADGSPAAFAIVRARYLDEVPEGTTSDGADEKTEFLQNGSMRLTGMRPGRWSLSVSPAGPGDGPDPQEIEIELGVEPKLTFHLP